MRELASYIKKFTRDIGAEEFVNVSFLGLFGLFYVVFLILLPLLLAIAAPFFLLGKIIEKYIVFRR